MGVCKYCGQISAYATDAEATAHCSCIGARDAQALLRAAMDAKGIVEDLFGEGCEAAGFTPLGAEIRAAICAVIDLIAKGDIYTLHLQVPGVCKIMIKRQGRQIKVERSEGKKVEQIAGEK